MKIYWCLYLIFLFFILYFLFIYMEKSGLYSEHLFNQKMGFSVFYKFYDIRFFYLIILIKVCNFKIYSAILSSMNSFKQKKMSNAFQQKTCVPLLQAWSVIFGDTQPLKTHVFLQGLKKFTMWYRLRIDQHCFIFQRWKNKSLHINWQ